MSTTTLITIALGLAASLAGWGFTFLFSLMAKHVDQDNARHAEVWAAIDDLRERLHGLGLDADRRYITREDLTAALEPIKMQLAFIAKAVRAQFPGAAE